MATAATISPYLVWMALMFALPQDAASYAIRAAAAAIPLVFCAALCRPKPSGLAKPLAWGAIAGLVVCALWIWPESSAWYRRWLVIGSAEAASDAPSPYDPAVCGWALTLAKLAGSAFVIAPAEELFFRSFLYRWLQRRDWRSVDLRRFDASAFLWTTALFALEHDRFAAGAMAGAAYGLLAMRHGICAAVTAHVVTNFALGVYVILRGCWAFW